MNQINHHYLKKCICKYSLTRFVDIKVNPLTESPQRTQIKAAPKHVSQTTLRSTLPKLHLWPPPGHAFITIPADRLFFNTSWGHAPLCDQHRLHEHTTVTIRPYSQLNCHVVWGQNRKPLLTVLDVYTDKHIERFIIHLLQEDHFF